LATAAPAEAEHNPREVLIGSIRLGSGQARAEPDARTRYEREAQKLYDDARDDLAQGHAASGQRLLEVLIARYPDTAAASHARHDIVALYSAAAGAQSEPPAAGQRSALGAGRAVSAPEVAVKSSLPLPEAPAVTEGWRAKVRVAAPSSQDDLRMQAGDRVFFGEGSAELGLKARSVLAAQAAWLKHEAGARVTLEGHADEPGSATENRALAERRAHAVRQRLIEEGVEPGRIAVVSFGRERPVAVCTDGVCTSQNRRVVTVVTDTRAADSALRGMAGTPR
jgi:peptidoglycan-associated lipoprotein